MKAKQHLIVALLIMAFLGGVIVLIYAWFRFNWPMWVLISLILIGIVLLILLIRVGYTAQWTGFDGKTLWDWLDLIAKLAIPLVVVLATIGFGLWQVYLADLQHLNDIEIAANQQKDATLSAYLDYMTNLLLKDKLHESKPGDELRNVARIQTLIVLSRLDPDRKVVALRFILEANLLSIINLDDAELSGIHLKNLRPIGSVDLKGLSLSYSNITNADVENYPVEHSIFYYTNLSYSTLKGMKFTFSNLSHVNLNHAKLSETDIINCNLMGADLSGANLSNVNLMNTDLSGANFMGADLSNVNLANTDLSGANFMGAKVTAKQLARAKSLKGATMPDGSKHL